MEIVISPRVNVSDGSVLVALLGKERKPDMSLLSNMKVPLFALLIAIK